MMTRVSKVVKNQRGVTLIELLAVIIILGIIAAIAVPAVMSNFDSAKQDSDKQTQAIISESINRLVLEANKNNSASSIDTTQATTGGGAGTSIIKINNFKDTVLTLGTYTYNFKDFISNYDSTSGQIKSAVDPTKEFNVSIQDGVISVTIE